MCGNSQVGQARNTWRRRSVFLQRPWLQHATYCVGLSARDNALAREEMLEIWTDSFTKDGREIRFQRAALTSGARLLGAFDPSGIELTAEVASKAGTRKKRKTAKKSIPVSTVLSSAEETLLKTLRTWRLSEARRRRIPAFRILGDRTLEALVRARPADLDELLDVHGIGPTIARKYGTKLLEVLASSD